jgi:N-formylmaleamate deformylase
VPPSPDAHRRTPVWHSGSCHANGIRVSYRRSGGRKPPLVALHGLIGSGTCLLPLARALSGYDVLLPDSRGHGGSSAPEAGYRYSDLADDVVGLIEELTLDAPILAGHSMGGMTAAVVASELGSFAKAVILIDPTFIGPELQREVYESDVRAEHQLLLQSTRDDLLAKARQRSPNRSAEIIQYLVDARLQTSMSAFEVLTPPNPDWRVLMRAIQAPTLLVTADRGIVSRETARELQGLNPLIQHQHVADVGHGLPYDEPERLGSLLLPFLSQATAIRSFAQNEE